MSKPETKSTETRNIHQILCEDIFPKIDAIEKSQTNKHQGFKFRGIDDVRNALHKLFKGLAFITTEVTDYKTEAFDRFDKEGERCGHWFSVHVKLKVTYRAADGSSVSTEALGHGMDTGDKAASKAMAMALKYALLDTFLIPTKDEQDPDGDSPEPSYPKRSSSPHGDPNERQAAPVIRAGGGGGSGEDVSVWVMLEEKLKRDKIAPEILITRLQQKGLISKDINKIDNIPSKIMRDVVRHYDAFRETVKKTPKPSESPAPADQPQVEDPE